MTITRVTAGAQASIDDLNQLIELLEGTSGYELAFLLRCIASSDFKIRLADAAGVREFIIQDSAGTSVATIDSDGNMTINGSFTPGTLISPTSTSPSQTAEGSIVWASDDDVLTVGDGASRKTFYPGTIGMQLLASSDTPVAITATSATDIVVISGLSIPVTSGFILEFAPSKDALAANSGRCGVKINATQVYGDSVVLSATQQVEDGIVKLEVGPRTAATPNWLLITVGSRITANGNAATATSISTAGAAMPVATITSITITGYNDTANNNLTIEWYRLWEIK